MQETTMMIIKCPMVEVAVDEMRDGDVVYYVSTRNMHNAQVEAHGPFQVHWDEKTKRRMLSNVNGSKFFLDTLVSAVKFYRRSV